MYVRDNQMLHSGHPFTILKDGEEFSFPANWLELATPEDLEYWGILYAMDPEPEQIPTVPAGIAAVTPRQIRQALTRVGLRANVEAAVAGADQDTKDWWEFATSIERANPQLVGMAQALGVSAAALDDLFALAASL